MAVEGENLYSQPFLPSIPGTTVWGQSISLKKNDTPLAHADAAITDNA